MRFETSMSFTISLSAEAEQKLRERAARSGQTVEGLVRELLEREASSSDPVPAAGALASLPAGPRDGASPVPAATVVNHRLAGTRITVWDIVYYLERGRTHGEIAQILHLSPEQVEAAVRYIEGHQQEVLEVHRKIEARIARGNPPEVQAKLDASHARFLEVVQKTYPAQDQV